MRNLAIACVLSGALVLPAMAALKAGDSAPDFSAQASLAGNAFTFSLKDALKNGPVVVYFFPAAYTGGCNIQAHEFAVNYDKFRAAGATVVGVSLDDIARLNTFSADPDYCGGKVPVASDTGGRIAKSYDLRIAEARSDVKDTQGKLIEHGFVERTTFVITPDDRIAATVGGVAPEANVAKALEIVRGLTKEQRTGLPR
jgi:peroxiredoxin